MIADRHRETAIDRDVDRVFWETGLTRAAIRDAMADGLSPDEVIAAWEERTQPMSFELAA